MGRMRDYEQPQKGCFPIDVPVVLSCVKEYKTSGSNNYKKQLMIELYTGMRMGEINALKPEDIDLANGVIHVRATISMGLGGRNFWKEHPKTDAGVRDVPINELERPETTRQEPCSMIIGKVISYPLNRFAISSEGYAISMICHTMDSTRFVTLLQQGASKPVYSRLSLKHGWATRIFT